MQPVPIMINGLPGNVTSTIAAAAARDARVSLMPYSLTGPDITATETAIAGQAIHLIPPAARETQMDAISAEYGNFISVDYTHPSAVNANADFYCRRGLPFVMGTTGGDREKLHATVEASQICAVIAPNMVKQIVGLQAMLEYAADNFPGIFSGYTLTVKESHQAGKADTSGTARAMVASFNRMGVHFSPDQIEMERDPKVQREVWGIPEAHIGGHGWHTYRLTSADDNVSFEFQHNINGREVYAPGTIDAVLFLSQKIQAGEPGRVYSMIDVLRV